MLDQAHLSPHDYLARKGFPTHQGLVLDGMLLVPMRDPDSSELRSLQTISADGEKRFLKGGRAKGSVFVFGAGTETYYCEGYATGLSIRAALTSLYRQVRVVVCFSAGNLAHVAKRGYVIADHDKSYRATIRRENRVAVVDAPRHWGCQRLPHEPWRSCTSRSDQRIAAWLK